MMKQLAAFLIAVTLSATAWAGFDAGVAAYKAKDYATALKEWQLLAEQGDTAAQNVIGVMYQYGEGVKQDFALAISWYRKAAEQGNANAQYNLGLLYTLGNGVQQSFPEAASWYRKAAEQGLGIAQEELGGMYRSGLGVKKDLSEAARWFRKAAEQGSGGAQNELGLIYTFGDGVQQNYAEAVAWYRKAADQGNSDAIGNLGWHTAKGWGTDKNLVEAERLLKLAASKGNEWAKGKLNIVACLKKASTTIFGEALNCTSKDELRFAIKSGGAKVKREDNGFWYDQYDSSAVLDGTSELSVAYINNKFAKAYYQFNSSMNTHKVVEVRDMVVSKYGKPSSSSGDPSLGEVSYTWKLKDGIKVEVSRGWPDTTVYLYYIHPVNVAAMETEMELQEQAEKAEKRGKQNRAF